MVFAGVVEHVETIEHFFVALVEEPSGELVQVGFYGKFWAYVKQHMSVAGALSVLDETRIRNAIQAYKDAVLVSGKDALVDDSSQQHARSSSSIQPPSSQLPDEYGGEDEQSSQGAAAAAAAARHHRRYRIRSLSDLFDFTLDYEDQVSCVGNGMEALLYANSFRLC